MNVSRTYELSLGPAQASELLREGARHEVDDGLGFDIGDRVELRDARMDDLGRLVLTFDVWPEGVDGEPALKVAKQLVVNTIEEIA